MSPFDSVGRIDKHVFLVSNLVLFALCLTSASARFYVRIRIQKQFSIDDGVLLFGIACLISAMALLFTFVDKMYLVGALENGIPMVQLPADFIEQAFDFQKLVVIALILTWCSMASVKFSYLFLFKKLINRVRSILIYWWFVVVFNALVAAYGASVYIVACPTFYNIEGLQCTIGNGLQRDISVSISQMVLDIVCDLLILYIPCNLIWRIQIRWTQKIALSCCLCLTVVTIICTITRISRIRTGTSIDSIWETYWQFIATNLALTMTSATAFRTFFVARITEKRPQSSGSKVTWYVKARQLLQSALRSRSSKHSADSSGHGNNPGVSLELPRYVPRGTMTGLQTFIRGAGRTSVGPSQIMHSMFEEEHKDSSPLSVHSRDQGASSILGSI